MNAEATPCGMCDCVDGEAPFERWKIPGEPLFERDGESVNATRRCPRRLIADDTHYLMEMFGHYKAGHLCAAGGLMKQPALYMDAMRAIDNAIARAKA